MEEILKGLGDALSPVTQWQEDLAKSAADFDRTMTNMHNVLNAQPVHPSAYSYSDTQFEIIKKHIKRFEASLDSEHEVGILLTNFGQSVLMQVTNITYEKSVLMIFRGFVNGNEATLIQHISQLNFLLTKVPKEEGKEKRKIGFGEQDCNP